MSGRRMVTRRGGQIHVQWYVNDGDEPRPPRIDGDEVKRAPPKLNRLQREGPRALCTCKVLWKSPSAWADNLG